MTDEPTDHRLMKDRINASLQGEIPECVRKPFRKSLRDLLLLIAIIIAGLASVLGGFIAFHGLRR